MTAIRVRKRFRRRALPPVIQMIEAAAAVSIELPGGWTPGEFGTRVVRKWTWFDGWMSKPVAVLLLLVAALLEAGGDAMVRNGLSASSWQRALWFWGGGIVLFGYGYTVNRPPWKFGELLGLYVVFFFVVAQVLSWALFHEAPSAPVWVGGGLIVGGGLVIALWR